MKPVYKTIIISIVVNVFLVILKLFTGVITNTKVLIADGVHSLSDLLTDIGALFGQKLSERTADEKHPRGHGKIEYITSIGIGIVVILIALKLIETAIKSPVNDINNNVILIVVITIIAKFLLSRYTFKKGKECKNNILVSCAIEHQADVLSSVAVLLTVLIYNLSPIIPILKYSDKIGTIVISLFILKTGVSILRHNLSLIIGESETDLETINIVKGTILKVKEVKSVDSIELIKYGSYYESTIKLGIDNDLNIEQAHKITNKVKNKLLKSNLNIKYVNTHINPHKKDS